MNATPAGIKNAKRAMTHAEDYILELVRRLQEDGVLDHHPEIAALADEAKTHAEGLRRSRRFDL